MINKAKPTCILYVKDEDEPLVLNGVDGQPMLFPNYKKAKMYAMKHFSNEEREHIRFVNQI